MATNGKANGKAKKLGGCTGRGFMPGKSGNPGGKVREIADLRALARQATPTIIDNLVHVVEHGRWPRDKAKVSDSVRMVAHLTLLDRGYGKPLSTAVIANLPSLDPPKQITKQMTPEEAAREYELMIKQGQQDLAQLIHGELVR
jgi:hypothetical protein